MRTFRNMCDNQKDSSPNDSGSIPNKDLKASAYSMDALIPGFYSWFSPLHLYGGGSEAEETDPGMLPSFGGTALVLPTYRIFHTYQGDFDPR
ncbi:MULTISPECIES: hypothetical protein [unclassified Coleofasciculus]|uniref:hypothetical protein n=1 Tax=unclassified Coleofasciculus TaxID=2692782 RepID=UPI001D1429D2|nr:MULTISPECIES: hypothetical protein [unclassified Coleofasciculus]